VEWTLDRVADDATAAQVGAQMRAVRLHDGDLSGRRPERREVAPQHALRQRLASELAAFTKQVPGGWIVDEAIRGRSLQRLWRHVLLLSIPALALRSL
jgi:hypothetical protein